MSALPLDSEIVQTVETLFAATASLDRTALWNALVPTDSDLGVNLDPGHKLVTRIPTCEFHEIMDLRPLFWKLAQCRRPVGGRRGACEAHALLSHHGV